MGPASGYQACGEIGDGRMLEPAQLLEEVIAALQPKWLANRRVLITAGPTFEPIDPVRRHHKPLLRQNGLCHRPCGT